MKFTRYAVYYCPGGALGAFGAEWLGWDSVAGVARAHPQIGGLPGPVGDLTARPRKYGFHGTVKPPFRLAPGTDAQGLGDAVARLCARLAPVELKALALARIGSFVALVPEGDAAALAGMAAQVVEGLDRFRAPPDEAELARRRQARLSPRQDENLALWGYPYVMEDFRFHLTLTGPLQRGAAEAVGAALAPVLAPLLPRPFGIGALCLLGEGEGGRFYRISEHRLEGEG